MRLRPRFERVARVLLAATLFGAALVAAVDGGSSSAASDPVSLRGGGSWASAQMITDWGNAVYGDPSAPKIDFNYTPHGTLLGREDLLAGNSDFAISGIPFTDDELSAAKKSADDYISAPIQVASLAFVISPPPTGFTYVTFTCNPDDPPPDVTDPTSCIKQTPYNDPTKPLGTADNPYLKIPNLNLAAMASVTVGDPANPIFGWSNSDVLKAMNLPSTSPDPSWEAPGWLGFSAIASPYSVLRSDGDETSYYFQQFLKAASQGASPESNDVWASVVHGVDPSADPASYPITERLPHISKTTTRDGAEQQVKQLGFNGADPASGTISDSIKGVMAPAPASAIQYAKSGFPKQFFELIAMKNGAGQWIAPTPDSLTAAAKAEADHDDEPLYAFSNDVSGAYPLTWIDRIYVPAHGLSTDATEALATTIRYVVTDGQAASEKAGEGKLADSQVAEALTAADKIVQSNCVGTDESVVKSSDPGRLAPDTVGMKAIGAMLHCDPVAAPATTSGSSSGFSASSSNFGSGSSSFGSSALPTLTPPASAAVASGASAPTTSTKKAALGALAAANLPTDRPGSNDTSDSVATFLIGFALFLLVYGPASRLVARLRA